MLKKHWTPSYAIARVAQAINELRHPNDPWMPRDAVEALDSLLRPQDIGLEFGSGRSTLWLSDRVARVTSIEESADWAAKVRSMVAHRGNVSLLLANHTQYVSALDGFADGSLDFCIVDGALRDACAISAIPKIRAGGFLLVDDAHRYLPMNEPAKIPIAVRQPASGDWQAVWDQVQSWRRMWFDDGVTATAIFIRV